MTESPMMNMVAELLAAISADYSRPDGRERLLELAIPLSQAIIDRESGKTVEGQRMSKEMINSASGHCPICDEIVIRSPRSPGNYCERCGQRLTWTIFEDIRRETPTCWSFFSETIKQKKEM